MSVTRTNQKRRIVDKMGNVSNCFKALSVSQENKDLYTGYIIRTNETFCRAMLSDETSESEWEAEVYCAKDTCVIELGRQNPELSDSDKEDGGEGSEGYSSDYDTDDGWDCSSSGDEDEELWNSFGLPVIPYAAEFIEQQISVQNIRVANEKTDKLYCSVDVKRSDSMKKVQFKPEPNLVTVIR